MIPPVSHLLIMSVGPYLEMFSSPLALFGLGFMPTQRHLAISSQMKMKLGRGILWVEIFTNG